MHPVTLKFYDDQLEAEYHHSRLNFLQLCGVLKRILIGIAIFCVAIITLELIRSIHAIDFSTKYYKQITYAFIIITGIILEYIINKKLCTFRTVPTFIVVITLVTYLSMEEFAQNIPYPTLNIL